MRFRSCAIATTLAVTLCAGRGQTAAPAVTIAVDATRPGGRLHSAWRFFGYDEPNFSYMKDGKALLADLATLGPQTVFVRTHNLLTSGDGTPAPSRLAPCWCGTTGSTATTATPLKPGSAWARRRGQRPSSSPR